MSMPVGSIQLDFKQSDENTMQVYIISFLEIQC